MIATRKRSRSGFTLIELIVAMSVIVILSAIALAVVPDVLSQDRTTEGAARLQQHLMIAKARATRDKLPRGIRLVNNGGFATEIQYIESPPIYVPPEPTTTPTTQFNLANASRIQLNYNAGNWAVVASNLPDPSMVTGGAIVLLPTLNTWFTIDSTSAGAGSDINLAVRPNSGITGTVFDPAIGVGTQIVVYQFGIYGSPQPMLGEPVQQLPSNVGVDLRTSPLSTTGLAASQEVLFSPAGDVMGVSNEQVMLWVRDITKPGGNTGNIADYQSGGEQQVVAIKARSGAVGVFPIAWPPATDPFQFAK